MEVFLGEEHRRGEEDKTMGVAGDRGGRVAWLGSFGKIMTLSERLSDFWLEHLTVGFDDEVVLVTLLRITKARERGGVRVGRKTNVQVGVVCIVKSSTCKSVVLSVSRSSRMVLSTTCERCGSSVG